MDADRWKRVQEIFEAALERPTADRAAFLSDACAGDDVLYREVASLLDADTAGHSLFGGNAIEVLPHFEDAFQDLNRDSGNVPVEGQEVGPFRIVRELGRGGMGVVYLADRADGAYEQRVALKLIRRGMDSEEILRRFQAERQILARLRHPGIARLLEGGRTGDGRPFFAVEFIDGDPIDVYCDRRQLSVDARLQLFEQVCEAVQYAHRNLVVHRDLKPSNILVMEEDGEPRVKLLDFGIAKLLTPAETVDPTAPAVLQTRTGIRVMTPEYAAPEQVRGEAPSTATDVYALGVILYELLTGRRPYRLATRLAHEVERAILEDEPERPSTALTRDAEAATLSRARAAETSRLRRRLEGDLDMICLMALRKETDRRYDSAARLLDDVRRHREGLPVTARPDTRGYRLRKFVRRHRQGVAVAAGGIVLVTALVGFYTMRLRQERDRAHLESSKSEQVIGFIERLFESNDPSVAHGDTLTVLDVMDAGAVRLAGELEDQPAVRARLMQVIGGVYKNLARYDEAAPLLDQAIAAQRQVQGATSRELAASLFAFGEIRHYQQEFDAADSLYRQALALQRGAIEGPNLETAATLDLLSRLEQERTHFASAESLATEALEMRRALVGESDLEVSESLQTLSLLRARQGNYAGAEQAARQSLAIRRKLLGDDHPEIPELLHNLAAILQLQGKNDEAEPLFREGLALIREIYGENHLTAAYFLLKLGGLAQDRQDYAEADSAYRAARSIAEANDNGSLIALSLNDLATLRIDQERYEDAESLIRAALAQSLKVFGPGHSEVAARLTNLGQVLSRRQRHDEAATVLRDALAIRETSLGADHPRTLSTKVALATALVHLNRLDEAELLLRESLASLQAQAPPHPEQIAGARSVLGAVLTARGRFDEAETLLTEAYEVLLAEEGDASRRTLDARERLVAFYEASGRSGEREALR